MLILIVLISITLPNENKEIIKETSVDGKDEDVYKQNITRYHISLYMCAFLNILIKIH